jgi:nitrite reductase/ring-hydroxylating ferredoxin subunit
MAEAAPSPEPCAAVRAAWCAALPASALADDGTGRTVELGGKRVALFRVGERVHALDDTCPHAGASLGGGVIVGGEVACPWHSFHFRLEDGANAEAMTEAVGTHPARIAADGTVEVLLPEIDPPA